METSMRLVALATAAILLAACGSVAITETAREAPFELTVTVPRLTYQQGEAIDVTASLTYIGPAPQVSVVPQDWGLVTIWFKQLDGPLSMAPLSRLICQRDMVTLERGVAMRFPATKVAAYEPGTSTGAIYQSWDKDPLVHLPAGRWQVDAHLTTCGGTGPGDTSDHTLTTPALILTVAP